MVSMVYAVCAYLGMGGLFPVLASKTASTSSSTAFGDYETPGANASNLGTLADEADKMGSHLEYWASIIVVILGAIALAIAAYVLVKNLISKARTGREQVSWILVAVLFVVAGAFFVGGWQISVNLANSLEKTVGSLAGSVVLPIWPGI